MQHTFDLHQSWFIAPAAAVGLAVGVWLTRLTHRLPRTMERKWQADCPNTGHSLHAPASYCSQCETPMASWRNPTIELLTSALFAACAWRFGPTPIALCGMALSATLVALAWIDLESRLLPDALTLPLAWAGLLVNLGDGFTPLPLAVLGAVAGYGSLWIIFHAWRFCTGRDGMGYGDFKLLAALGAWFGVDALPRLLLSASLVAMLAGGTLLLMGRGRWGRPLAFGPYLALAGMAVLLQGDALALLLIRI